MRLRVINPNTTESMTAAIGAGARRVAGPGVVVEAVEPWFGPESVESHADEVMAAAGVLSVLDDTADAHVVACFGDPGLAAARERMRGPVVGIAEAAMHTATFLGRRFSVVTTLQRSVGGIEELTHAYGVAGRCGGVHASGIAVVDLESDPCSAERVRDLARHVLAEDRSDVIVLGCAGMTDFRGWLEAELGVPVVDGVAAATTTAVGLVRQGLATSSAGEFSTPAPKHVRGRWADLDPSLNAGETLTESA